MLKILKHGIKVIGLLLLGFYLLLLAHIPLLEFSVSPSFSLGIWLAGIICLFALTIWATYAYSRIKLGVLIILALATHIAPSMVPSIRIAFEIDSCLDQGGRWENEACDLGDQPLSESASQ